MTELVISTAMEQLESLLDEKAAEKEQLEGLRSDLSLMLDFLGKSSRRSSLDHLTSQVREIAHDAFILTTELKSSNFRTEMESVRSNFREVNLQSPVQEAEDDVVRQMELPPWKDNEGGDMVGLAEIDDKLIGKLLHSEKRLYISMISGMGGIGKTSLARKIYNHASVAGGFHHRGWACVSGDFRPEEVLRVLIQQVADIDEEELKEKADVQSLQEMLYQHLWGRTYFIVLDDAWDDTHVNHVLRSLPRNDNSSRVLLNGRSSNIVQNLDFVVNMSHLDSHASWQLFEEMVFNSHGKCPKELEEIGRKIVKKCNGLPFAIKEAGMQLVTRLQSKSVWEEFLESMNLSATMTLLESSYHRLPPKLKSCFVYMSFFGEGTTMRANKFVHIWNAAGMIRRGEVDDARTMEETARMYLDKLCRENMIMVVDYTTEEKLKIYRLDAFLHKISIAKAEEEISLEILGNKERHRPPCIPRHRVINSSREKFSYLTDQGKHLLSLSFRGFCNFAVSPSYWESFEQLRILDFEGYGLKTLSKTMCALERLRYLGLRDNYIQELPRTLGHLANLEVLDIALNFTVEVLDIIWEMDSLRHLYMSDIICRTPLKIDSLKNLQTLTYISVDNWMYELSNLEKMTSLRKLGIEELDEDSDVSRLFTSLAKLTSLKCLILRGLRFRSMPPLDDLSSLLDGLTQLKLDGRLTMLPKFPQDIKFLTLVNSCLDEDPMPELENLPSLYYLKLRNAFTVEQIMVSDDGFAALRYLYIGELWHLRNFEVEFGAVPILKRLEISNCPYLETLSENFEFIHELKMCTTKNIARKIRKSDLIFEIPSVDIQPKV